MKKIYLNKNTKSKKMSPIGFKEISEYKVSDVKESGLEEYIHINEFNKAMTTMTKALEIGEINNLKDFLRLNIKELS